MKCNQLNTHHTSLSFLSFSSRPTTKNVDCFETSFGVNIGKQGLGFHGENRKCQHTTSLAKVVGRFTHEPGSVGRGLELRFFTQISVLQGSGLPPVGVISSEQNGLIRLQIDSTDRCEYSATSVDVFTHYFMS